MDTFALGSIHPTALISVHASLGDRVTIGPFTVVHDGVDIGDDSVIGSHCVLGEPTGDFYRPTEQSNPDRCIVGARAIIRSHCVLYQGVTIGSDFRSGHRVTIREQSTIGDDVQVGTSSDLQGDLTIGDHVRVHSGVFIAQLSTIERFAWLFPRVVLANDPHPPSDTCTQGPTVREFAAIGAQSTLMPGVEIGRHALVGAMSLVTHDVEAGIVVVGTPAKPVASASDITCKHDNLDQVYPWPVQFRRGYTAGAFDSVDLDG